MNFNEQNSALPPIQGILPSLTFFPVNDNSTARHASSSVDYYLFNPLLQHHPTESKLIPPQIIMYPTIEHKDLLDSLNDELRTFTEFFNFGANQAQQSDTKVTGQCLKECSKYIHTKLHAALEEPRDVRKKLRITLDSPPGIISQHPAPILPNPEIHSRIAVYFDRKGQKHYKLDGEDIKFKVLKNRPKNGAFKLQWADHFGQLQQYFIKFGHTNVTRSTTGFEELGNWVAEQRRKLKKGRITMEQFEALNTLNFEWDRSYYFYNTFHKRKEPNNNNNSENNNNNQSEVG